MSGDTVNIYGGTNNTGIIKNQYSGAAQPAPQAFLEAIEELSRLLRELRDQVAPATVQVIDDSLPVISSQASAPQERHRALIAVATSPRPSERWVSRSSKRSTGSWSCWGPYRAPVPDVSSGEEG